MIEEDPSSKPIRFLLGLRGSMTQRDGNAMREVAKRETANNQPARQERSRHVKIVGEERGDGASRERGGGATREATARHERHWRGKRGDDATTNRWRQRGAMRQALAWR
jgi:hypothetical protein